MEIQLRRATPEDAAALAAVEIRSWRAAYRGLMPATLLDGLSEVEKAESWHQNLLKHGPSGRKRVWIALGNAGMTGFVRVGPEMDEGEVGLIYLVYVLPEQWGRGVGAALMQAGMNELHDLGMREATLWALRDNLRARRFYERLGWTPDGRIVSEDYSSGSTPNDLAIRGPRLMGIGVGKMPVLPGSRSFDIQPLPRLRRLSA